MPLYLFLFFSYLSLFQPPPPSIYPLHLHNNQPTAAADKKFWGGFLVHRLSHLLPSHSLSLSMPLYLFSLLFFFSLSLFFIPPPATPKSALYPPYASLSFLSLSFFSSLSLFLYPHPYIGLISLSTLWISIFSLSLILLLLLFLTITYVLMDNFLSLFTLLFTKSISYFFLLYFGFIHLIWASIIFKMYLYEFSKR